MLHLLQMGPSNMLTTFPLQIQSSLQLLLLELPPCCVPTRNTVTLSSDSSDMYTSTVQSGPPRLMLHSCFTLIFKLLIPLLLNLCLLPLPPHYCTTLLTVLLRLLPPLPPLTFSGFFNGMLEIFEPGALNYFTLFCPIVVTLTVSRNPILTHLPYFGFLDSLVLRTDHTHFQSGILSPDATHASGSVIIFVRQGLSFSELSTSIFSSLDPYSNYVGVKISLNNSSSLSFLNVYAPPIRSSHMNSRIHFFSPSILPSSRNLFILGDFNCHHPLWD